MKLLTAIDVARKFSVTTQTVWRWSRTGKIPEPISIAGSTRWIDEDLDAMILSKKESEGTQDGSQGKTEAI